MRMKKVIKLFENGNVCVFGLRGKGKDMLLANVIMRRKLPYLSNMDYGGKFIPLDLETLDCGKNKYENFIEGKVKKYIFPYPDETDIYISDAGIYFPAQYCNELNKKYPHFATFQSLTRQLGLCNFHTNAQALNRVYDKIREQSDTYILCMNCKVLLKGKVVIQRIRTYDMYESAERKVPPLRLSAPLFNKEAKATIRTAKEKYKAEHGTIKTRWLFYINKSKYDTRYFKKLLASGEVEIIEKGQMENERRKKA